MATRVLDSAVARAGNVLGPQLNPLRYRLLRQLNQSKHAVLDEERSPTVWEARDSLTGGQVVVKIVRAGTSRIENAREGFLKRLLRAAAHSDNTDRAVSDPSAKAAGVVKLLDSFCLPAPDVPTDQGSEEEEDDFADVAAILEPLAREDLRAHKPSFNPLVKLVGFTTSCWDYGDGGSNPYNPSDWLVASPEQMLNSGCYGAFGPPRATDIWQIGIFTSNLLFDKNLALPDLDLPTRFSPSIYGNKLEQFPLSPVAINYLASLDRDAGWPKFFDETNLFEHNPRYPFNLPGVVPLPSLRERIEAEGVLSNTHDVDLVTSFLRACWTLDPYKRASSKELLEHQFVKGVEVEQ
ncbi:hypothetical protein JCM6882_006037 [Rhodosporidiobolus microsporus]